MRCHKDKVVPRCDSFRLGRPADRRLPPTKNRTDPAQKDPTPKYSEPLDCAKQRTTYRPHRQYENLDLFYAMQVRYRWFRSSRARIASPGLPRTGLLLVLDPGLASLFRLATRCLHQIRRWSQAQ